MTRYRFRQTLLRLDKERGITLAITGAIMLLAVQVARVIVHLIGMFNPVVLEVVSVIRVELWGVVMDFDGIFVTMLVLYAVKLATGFVKGILITAMNVVATLAVHQVVFDAGKLPLLVTHEVVAGVVVIDFTPVFLVVLAGYGIALGIELFLTVYQVHGKVKAVRKGILPGADPSATDPAMPSDQARVKRWVDPGSGRIVLASDERLVTPRWEPVHVEHLSSAFRFFVTNSLVLFSFGILYGVIRYFIFDTAGGTTFDNASRGMSFFLWGLLMQGFKSPRHLARTAFFLLGTIAVQLWLRDSGFITVQGMFFLSILVSFMRLFMVDLAPFLDAVETPVLAHYMYQFTGLFITIQLVVVMLFSLLSRTREKKVNAEALVSTSHVYFREKRWFNNYALLFELLGLWIWPLNPESYRVLAATIRYKNRSMREGLDRDHGRLPVARGLATVRKREMTRARALGWSIITIAAGIATAIYFIGFFLIPLGIWYYFDATSKRGLVTVSIRFKRRRAGGALFTRERDDMIVLRDLEPGLAATLPGLPAREQ